MRILKLVLLFLVGILTTACPGDGGIYKEVRLDIYNHSDKDVYFQIRGKDPIYYSSPPSKSRLILSNSFHTGKDEFKALLQNGNKMYIWLFDKKVIDSIPWKEVIEKDLYLIRYDLTLEDLEEMDWKITYDGN